jgi:hypothetical protein
MRVRIPTILLVVLLPLTAGAWQTGNLRLRGRLQTRFEVDFDQDSSAFSIERARFDGRWKPSDWVRLILEFEGAGLVGPNNQEDFGVEMLDAYGRFDVDPALRIHIGQFKKPFSRLKMMSPFALYLPFRGLLNRYAVDRRCSWARKERLTDEDFRVRRSCHGGYGGRDVGVMLSGRFKELARLQYYLGVFSGPGIVEGHEESHKDIVGRLQFRPFKGLRLAVNATHKLYHPGPWDVPDLQFTANMFGADLRYKIEKFTLLLEGAFGDNLLAGPGYSLWGAHGTAAYAVSLTDDLVLTPAVAVEVFDTGDLNAMDDEHDVRAVRLAFALNLDIGEICRVILFAEHGWGRFQYWNPVDPDNPDEPFPPAVAEDRPVATRFFVQVDMAY